MRKQHYRILAICGIILAVLVGVYFIGSGFNVREDVVLIDYAAPPDENEMTITVGVASSAGYTRTYKNVSDNPKVIKLQFYSAFGGVNGTIGEDHRFVIDVPPECEEICFYRYGTFDKILYWDAETGQWMRVE